MMSKGKQELSGNDNFCRMNFLYQASMLMAGHNNTLSSYYGEQCRTIAKKTVLSCDPELKRNLCKHCHLAQQPGVTAELHIKTQNNKRGRKRKHVEQIEDLDENAKILIECKQCQNVRNLTVNSNYKFWLENPAAIAEVCESQ